MSGEPTNQDRADWAERGLIAFSRETGQDLDDDGAEEIISDFLADLMHYCRIEKVDFARCVARGQAHYNEEVNEEAENERRTKP